MTSLIGRRATCYHNGEVFAEGEIVATHPSSVWILLESGFMLQCLPSSVKVEVTK